MTKLPNDIKQSCLWLIRGYERRVKEYRDKLERIDDIIYSTSPNFDTYTDKGKECRVYQSHTNITGDPTASKASKIELIEHHYDTKVIRAVEQAKNCIGCDLCEDSRQKLIKAMWQNCIDRYEYPFEVLGLEDCGFSRRDYYRRRMKFLINIAELIGMV